MSSYRAKGAAALLAHAQELDHLAAEGPRAYFSPYPDEEATR